MEGYGISSDCGCDSLCRSSGILFEIDGPVGIAVDIVVETVVETVIETVFETAVETVVETGVDFGVDFAVEVVFVSAAEIVVGMAFAAALGAPLDIS